MEDLVSPAKRVVVGPALLEGDLTLPARARGLVVFAHGSGSTRRSPRNREVAKSLQQLGLGTLLFDLLTSDEAADPAAVFDIDLLSHRLVDAVDWLDRRPVLAGLPLGLFGASTGAAAALVAAARRPQRVLAVVSRGGRPDMAAAEILRTIKAPTLLIVGGADKEVLALNRQALKLLRGPAELQIVPQATHLFEERGALQRVTELAAQWFDTHLVANAAAVRAAEPR